MRRSGRTAHGALAAAVLAAALLSGCTSQGTGVITQAIDPTSASVTSVSTAASVMSVSTTAPAGESSSNPPTLDSTATSTDSSAVIDGSSSVPAWPADFTPAQQQAAALSLQVVSGFMAAVAQAEAAPAQQDWTPVIRRYSGDPAAHVALRGVQSMVTFNIHAEASLKYDQIRVVSADDHRVTVSTCMDSSSAILRDPSGTDVFQRPEKLRQVEIFTLAAYDAQYAPEGWLVFQTSFPDPAQPC